MTKKRRQQEMELVPRSATVPMLLMPHKPSNQTISIQMSDGGVVVVPMRYMEELGRKLTRRFT